MEHKTGIVEWFANQPGKQFGKIRDGERLIFFHRDSRICGADTERAATEGDEVTYASESSRRGPRATWWAFGDEFDSSQVPVDEDAKRAEEGARRVAELMIKKLEQFGFSDLEVIGTGTVSDERSFPYTRKATSRPTTITTLLTDPASAFDLNAYETVSHKGVIEVYQDGEKIGRIHNMRFLYHRAPSVEVYLAFAFATDLEMVELPEDAVTNTAQTVRKLLNRLTTESDKTEAQQCYKNRFYPQLKTLFHYLQRTGRIAYKKRIFMWSYEEASVHFSPLWHIAVREKFGDNFSFGSD